MMFRKLKPVEADSASTYKGFLSKMKWKEWSAHI